MQNFLVAIIWTLITSVLVKYSLFFGFNYNAGNIGPILISVTILWLSAFFKTKS